MRPGHVAALASTPATRPRRQRQVPLQRVVRDARPTRKLGDVQQAGRPRRQQREKPRHIREAVDVRQIPNVALQDRRDVAAQPSGPAMRVRPADRLGIAAPDDAVFQCQSRHRRRERPGCAANPAGSRDADSSVAASSSVRYTAPGNSSATRCTRVVLPVCRAPLTSTTGVSASATFSLAWMNLSYMAVLLPFNGRFASSISNTSFAGNCHQPSVYTLAAPAWLSGGIKDRRRPPPCRTAC